MELIEGDKQKTKSKLNFLVVCFETFGREFQLISLLSGKRPKQTVVSSFLGGCGLYVQIL